MQKVLIHSLPRSASKTLQYIINQHFINEDFDPLCMSEIGSGFGLGEFFVNREDIYHYYEHVDGMDSDVLKFSPENKPYPPGSFWKTIVKDDTGLHWKQIPTGTISKSEKQILKERMNLLKPYADRYMVAKMFTGTTYLNVPGRKTLDVTNDFFDTHIVLLRKNIFDCFLSAMICWRTGIWSVSNIDQATYMRPFTIPQSELKLWMTVYEGFIEYVKGLKEVIVIYTEDMLADPLYLKNKLGIDLKPDAFDHGKEYGTLKYSLIQNLFEVKKWFEDWTPPEL